jgi:hypothetical protein
MRGESIWVERERAVVLTNNGGWRRCSSGNQRGGGVSGGGSRRDWRVGGGEGGELKLRCGRGTERSEAPVASPNGGRVGRTREGNGGVGSVLRGGRKTGEREGPGRGGWQRGPRGRDGQRQKRTLATEVGWRTGEGGGARATRCGGQRWGVGGRE